MKIATCKSRRQKQYHNLDITWDVFTERLKSTVRTRETVAEYKSMSRDEQSEIKDVGGFVGGELKGGRRNNQSVLSRSMITLDADFADSEFIDNIDMLYGYACVIYSTHKHTPAKSNKTRPTPVTISGLTVYPVFLITIETAVVCFFSS